MTGKTQKDLGSISITNTMLENALAKLLGWENSNMITLLQGMIEESPKGAEWFMKISMGESLPMIPLPGMEVYVPIDKLGWNVDSKDYKASSYNENGFIKCTVVTFRGFHHYSPLMVELPKLDPSDKTAPPVTTHIDVTDWKDADSDFYDREQDAIPTPKLYNAIARAYKGKI